MKLLGAGFLWVSLICVGVNYARELKERRMLIEKTVLMIKQFIIEIEFLKLPLFEMVQKISQSSSFKSLGYLDKCHCMIKDGMDFPVAWKTAVNESNEKYNRGEKDKLLLLGESLGSTDINGQISILNVYENYFSQAVTIAKEKERKYANLYITLGVLFGSMMFIIII